MPWNEQGSEPDLTPRESEVLELVANGLSAKEVAHEIGIAPRTVERHIENVRMKMRARNRAHMVAQAVLNGVLVLGTPAGPRACEGCLFQHEAKGSESSHKMKH
ncbi:response regulator transcription factor [Allosphingosinicella vermicomposti]|uniref:response regulator transcription factor n=1 Tax=Allosphingosinicella vermicomposti TaxID=614671 RepID=UPI000D0F4B30|nr:helix-turn-helix transcriptional regulator [Allosphingosinicella vermicomposti]